MRRYRLTIILGVLFLLWLAFGSQILHQASQRLTPIESVPPLPGRLFYTQGFEGVWQVNMSTGAASQWWAPPEGGFVTGIAASPDGTRLAIAYAPPAEEGFQIGTTDLYLSPSDAPEPEPLFVRTDRSESYRNPFWSPDGSQLYYTHVTVQRDEAGDTAAVSLTVERALLESSTTETVLENAEQMTLSPDASQAVYLQFDPVSYGKAIWVMAADGSEAREVLNVGSFQDVSNPRFGPDGSALVFSGSGDYQGDPTRLAMAGIVRAHGLPWDIWQIGLDGSGMTKLTETTLDSPWIAWGPDATSMAVIAAEGIFVRYQDRFYRIVATSTHGEITWVP